jgi:hypothetical protein
MSIPDSNWPIAGDNRGTTRVASRNRSTLHSIAPVDLVLSRLENVKRHRDGWTACCPLHDSKSKNSLSITANDDGSVMMHDFGQCKTIDILHHIGLELKDLYPQDITNFSPMERQQRKRFGQISKWSAARDMLQHETRVIWVAGRQIRGGEPLNEADSNRLDLAMERVTQAGRVLNGYP